MRNDTLALRPHSTLALSTAPIRGEIRHDAIALGRRLSLATSASQTRVEMRPDPIALRLHSTVVLFIIA